MNSPQAQYESECAPDFDYYLDSAEYQKWLAEVHAQHNVEDYAASWTDCGRLKGSPYEGQD